MATSKQTAVRFTVEDAEVVSALRGKMGIQSTTEIVRLALRTLARAQGLDLDTTSSKAKRLPKPKPVS